ncbi:MAG: hypothetical protein PHC48_02670 [Prevotella sp.]|nr:hypothetical protein [Prevotella sp.]
MGFPEAKWAVDQVVSKVGIQPNNMRKFTVLSLSANTVGLQFLEPADSYYSAGGALAAVTKGVMIRMSDEDYPQGLNDGTLVLDNQNLGGYENTSFVVSGLTEGQEYFFSAFPYSNIGVYNESLNAANKASGISMSGETVIVNVTIDDAEIFAGTDVRLKNITHGTQVVKHISTQSSVSFSAKAGDTFKVEVDKVEDYRIASIESSQFTAVVGGTRQFTFAYTRSVGFIYTIKFDNGGDGIPSSFSYLDDCEGFTPMNGSDKNSWADSKIFNHFRPCLIKPGMSAPEYYLNPDNYNQKENGTSSVLTGADGDVMIEVKQLYYKVEKLTSTSEIKLSVSSYQPDSLFKPFLKIAGAEQDVAYRGVYEAYTLSNQMRSISGFSPTVGQTRAVFRNKAAARGTGYSQNDYYLLFMWQCMYILLYGSRDSQTVLGKGRTAIDNATSIATGTMNDKPFCWGDQTGTNGVKFLGVENFYGNVYEFVDGLTLVDYSYKITRDQSKYDDVGTSYETTIPGAPVPSGFIKSMKGVEDGIFLPNETVGSETTYFCDNFYQNAGTRVAHFGGTWPDVGNAGAFLWALNGDASTSNAIIGSRLCRKKIV